VRDISGCLRKCSKVLLFTKIPKIIFYNMQCFSFVLLIFMLEALVLLREVTRDVFLRWISCEYAVADALALYLCHTNKSVLLNNGADYNARQG